MVTCMKELQAQGRGVRTSRGETENTHDSVAASFGQDPELCCVNTETTGSFLRLQKNSATLGQRYKKLI